MIDQELIKALMQAKGCKSQKDAAEILGVTQAAISAILAGRANLGNIGRTFINYLLAEDKLQAERDAEKLRRITVSIHAPARGATMATWAGAKHYADS